MIHLSQKKKCESNFPGEFEKYPQLPYNKIRLWLWNSICNCLVPRIPPWKPVGSAVYLVQNLGIRIQQQTEDSQGDQRSSNTRSVHPWYQNTSIPHYLHSSLLPDYEGAPSSLVSMLITHSMQLCIDKECTSHQYLRDWSEYILRIIQYTIRSVA